MAQGSDLLAKLAPKLWATGNPLHAFALLDGASNEGLLDALYGEDAPRFECLLTGELAPDMAMVAPYLAELREDGPFARWAVEGGWGRHWGVYALSTAELPELWRHLRTLTMVYDPEGKPLYFRFYDPRVLRIFLPSCDADQVRAFFGPVERFVLEGETPDQGIVFMHKDGALIQERFSVGAGKA